MPRPERPLDPADGVVQAFAYELRKLRQDAAGMTYRELAARSGYSVTTLSQAAAGRRLPSLDVALAYAQACGGDPTDWRAKWHAAAVAVAEQRPDQEPETAAARAPYRGLSSFRAEDADLFFGRERLVDEVVRRVTAHRVTMVLGASGVGKSSLLAAGVLPALRADAAAGTHAQAGGRSGGRADGHPLRTLVMTPGSRPLDELRGWLRAQPPEPPGGLLVVADQFEEVFTQCDPERRTEFIDELFRLVDDERRCRVVLGVRADFYGRCAEHRALADALRNNQVLVPPIGPEELREAVTRPAAAVGLSVERALVAAVDSDASGRPGALPLVSHAMLRTWQTRRGDVLTLAGYQAAGGVRGALVRTAEAAYAGLEPAHQRLAAEVMLRLVVADDAVTTTRRRVDLAELLDTDPDADQVLTRLADARLLTIDRERVEIAHEALIEHWPRLREWLAEDREGLRVHQQLTDATRAWQALGEDPSALYRGMRLAIAAEWARRAGTRTRLTGAEQAFLDASLRAEASQRALERRHTSRLRGLAGALALFLVVALVATAVAFVQARNAGRAGGRATSRQLAAEARLLSSTDVAGALRKAVEAYRTAPTKEARSVVLSLAGRQTFHGRLAGHTGRVESVAISRDGSRLVSAGQDGRAIVWDVRARRPLRTLQNARRIRDVAISPDAALVAIAGAGTLTVRRVADGSVVARPRGHTGSVESVAFGPDGNTLVSVDGDGTAILWDTHGFRVRAKVPDVGGMNSAVAVHPDRAVAAVAGQDGAVRLLDLATGKVTKTFRTGVEPLYAVAFHPSDGSLVAAGNASALFVWDRSGERRTVPTNVPGRVHDLSFQDDGDRRGVGPKGSGAGAALYCACGRQTMVWDPADYTAGSRLGSQTGAVYAIATSADGDLVGSAGVDGVVLLWDRAQAPLRGHGNGIRGLAVSPDGRTLASADANGVIALWHTADRDLRGTYRHHSRAVSEVAYHPRRRWLAAASFDHTVTVWDRGMSQPAVLEHSDQVHDLAFHPTRPVLVTAGADGRVLRWRLDRPSAAPTQLHRRRDPAVAVAFSPDGRFVASAGRRGEVLLTAVTSADTVELAGYRGPVDTVTFSPDGRLLAAASVAGDTLLWRTDSPRHGPRRLDTQPVAELAFSPDGRYLAGGSNDQTVILWDVARRTEVATLTGHTDNVHSLAWSPDSTTLYSGSADRSIIAWPVDPDAARADLCAQLADNFRSKPSACDQPS